MTFAGTGKSEVNKAFLWFAFQYGASDMISVTSYTWKAAQLLGTTINPGTSTTTLLKTPTHGRKDNESSHVSEQSIVLFDRKKKIILDDEASFNSLHHNWVSSNHCFDS